MDLIQWEIESGADCVKLARTPRWLLSPTAMEVIQTDPKKRTVSVKITVMSVEDKNKTNMNSIWFNSKHHRADSFTEISPDTLCIVYYY